jgi:hypothetical protein
MLGSNADPTGRSGVDDNEALLRRMLAQRDAQLAEAVAFQKKQEAEHEVERVSLQESAGQWPTQLLKQADEKHQAAQREVAEAAASQTAATFGRRLDSFRTDAESQRAAEQAEAARRLGEVEQQSALVASETAEQHRQTKAALQAETAVSERQKQLLSQVREQLAAAEWATIAAEKRETAERTAAQTAAADAKAELAVAVARLQEEQEASREALAAERRRTRASIADAQRQRDAMQQEQRAASESDQAVMTSAAEQVAEAVARERQKAEGDAAERLAEWEEDRRREIARAETRVRDVQAAAEGRAEQADAREASVVLQLELERERAWEAEGRAATATDAFDDALAEIARLEQAGAGGSPGQAEIATAVDAERRSSAELVSAAQAAQELAATKLAASEVGP